jgi:hypothetical protein
MVGASFQVKKGLPFGSFTMDLFTAKSDLDLSVNFSTSVQTEFPRKDKISAIRRVAKVLHDHQSNFWLDQIFITSFLARIGSFTFECTDVHCVLLNMCSYFSSISCAV